MIFIIKNEFLEAEINSLGAELHAVTDMRHGTSYLHDGDEKFWSGRAPVLFPFVGKLRGGEFIHNGKRYAQPQHGFARRLEFELENRTDDSAAFVLKDTPQTLENYPFHFTLRVTYTLKENTLSTQYQVQNEGGEPMFFSIGGHPAFKCPVFDDEEFEDYDVIFAEDEPDALIHAVTEDGLVNDAGKPFFVGGNKNVVSLDYDLFKNDALVLSNLRSKEMALESRKSGAKIIMRFEGFPLMGVWTRQNAPFVCFEPWLGVADYPEFDDEVSLKKHIQSLPANETFTASFDVTFEQ